MSNVSCAYLALPLCLAVTAAGAQAAKAPNLDQLRSATIAGVFEGPVTLVAGTYEGEPYVPGGGARPRLMLVGEPLALDDFDGAEGDAAAAMLSESSGGSGERIWLAVIALRNGRAESLGTALVGDRVRIRSLAAKGADLVLEVVEVGPNDPACCPTQAARRTYRLWDGGLTLTGETVTGTLSLALVAGQEWTLLELDGEALPAELKAPTLEVKNGRIAGFDGCNRFMGKIEDRAPGQVVVGPLAGTRMACPAAEMELETRFLDALGTVTRYDFLAGRLLLSGQDGETQRTLLLTPGESGSEPR
jgi:heat shock protein HslJ